MRAPNSGCEPVRQGHSEIWRPPADCTRSPPDAHVEWLSDRLGAEGRHRRFFVGLERFSFDVNRNGKGVPRSAQIRFVCFDSNGEVGRWRRDTRSTSGRGRSRLSKTAKADGKRRECSGSAPRPQSAGSSARRQQAVVTALPGSGYSRSPLEAHRQWLLIWSQRSRT